MFICKLEKIVLQKEQVVHTNYFGCVFSVIKVSIYTGCDYTRILYIDKSVINIILLNVDRAVPNAFGPKCEGSVL